MMGQQGAQKTRKKIGAITTQLPSSKGTSFPLDLISEVLLKLPAKSVAKSRCVSKLCSSIISLPCFIRSYAARSSKSACLVILLREGDKLFVLSLLEDQHSNKNNPLVVDSYSMTYPKDHSFESAQSINGLICVSKSGHPQIWNPTTRRFSNIPKPDRRWKSSTSFLGYDPIEGTYKVLSMPCSPFSKCSNHPRALTLGGGGQESWRVIQGIPEHIPFGFGQCIDGVLYYVASPIHGLFNHQFLVSFHVRTEKLTVIKVPWTFNFCFLITYEGKLVSVSSKADDIILWILEDAEKEEWSCKHIRLPFARGDRGSKTRFHLSGVNDAGEFIYVPKGLGNPFQIIYFQPKATNSFRTVVVEGVVDDQYRLRNGLGDKPLYNLTNYTNHMESFISF